MRTPGEPPPSGVLEAFGVSGPAAPLPGGQGRAWRVGAAVLKPADLDAAAVAWQARVLTAVDGQPRFRVSPPLPATDGRWVVSGWTAWRWEAGEYQPGRWDAVVHAGDELHAALAGVPAPAWLAHRDDVWAVADRVAWGELPVDRCPDAPHLARLAAALRPVSGRPQLIHGDLTGNVLLHDRLAPLVIDLSPYWRPPRFARAVVVADALVFHAAGPDVVQLLGGDSDDVQYLIRALAFRIVAAHLARPGAPPRDSYRAAVDLALARAGGAGSGVRI